MSIVSLHEYLSQFSLEGKTYNDIINTALEFLYNDYMAILSIHKYLIKLSAEGKISADILNVALDIVNILNQYPEIMDRFPDGVDASSNDGRLMLALDDGNWHIEFEIKDDIELFILCRKTGEAWERDKMDISRFSNHLDILNAHIKHLSHILNNIS